MILVAPDKFKGTLSALEATDIISQALWPLEVKKAPMADGGEGTAAILCRDSAWEKKDTYYHNKATNTAVIDSSAIIGLQLVEQSHRDVLSASSYSLGLKVRSILDSGVKRVIIGVGGTSTCDGGLGFLDALGPVEPASILGLCDVAVPLLAPGDKPSALMFAPQKGASEQDIEILRSRLSEIINRYPDRNSPFDGAGGGLGFAIASVIGAKCMFGAKYVLDSYDIDWSSISLVITGEGKIDSQTECGKVVDTVTKEAFSHGIPTIAFGGIVSPELETDTVISTSRFYPDDKLNSLTAAKRLDAAVRNYLKNHIID